MIRAYTSWYQTRITHKNHNTLVFFLFLSSNTDVYFFQSVIIHSTYILLGSFYRLQISGTICFTSVLWTFLFLFASLRGRHWHWFFSFSIHLSEVLKFRAPDSILSGYYPQTKVIIWLLIDYIFDFVCAYLHVQLFSKCLIKYCTLEMFVFRL